MQRPHLKRRTLIILAMIGAAVIVLGLWTWRAWERARDYAKVEVYRAESWQHRNGDQLAGSKVTIARDTPYHRPYADAEVVVENWTDDCGTNLLISALRTSHFLEARRPQNPFWGFLRGRFPSSSSPNAKWIPPSEAARNGFRAERSPLHTLNTYVSADGRD